LTNGVMMNGGNPRISSSLPVERVGNLKRDDDATNNMDGQRCRVIERRITRKGHPVLANPLYKL